MSFTEAWIEGPKACQFFTRTYLPSGPPKAAIVFVHGFIEHIARYEHVFPLWQQRGIAVLAFDGRGFGQTAVGEKRSRDSAYGKTSWPDQFADIEFFLLHLKKQVQTDNIFLMGHSMGGALSLGFVTRQNAPPSPDTVKLLKGVIATSPLLRQASPAPKWQLWLAGKFKPLIATNSIPAEVKAEDLSHDPEVGAAYLKDPLVKFYGTVAGVHSMLTGGMGLCEKDHKSWPTDLPVLLIHGSEDKVTSHPATETFFKALATKDKHFSSYPGGYHELQNEPEFKDKLLEECISWVEARCTTASPAPVAGESAPDAKL